MTKHNMFKGTLVTKYIQPHVKTKIGPQVTWVDPEMVYPPNPVVTRPGKPTKSDIEAMAIEIVDDYPLIAW